MDKIKGDLRYIVINKKFLDQLTISEQETINNILCKMDTHENQYLVCNVDESYAADVANVIFASEYFKNKEAKGKLLKFQVQVSLKSGAIAKFTRQAETEEEARIQVLAKKNVARILGIIKVT